MTAPTYRKIGGIHWFRWGRWRVSVCRVKPTVVAPKAPLYEGVLP